MPVDQWYNDTVVHRGTQGAVLQRVQWSNGISGISEASYLRPRSHSFTVSASERTWEEGEEEEEEEEES